MANADRKRKRYIARAKGGAARLEPAAILPDKRAIDPGYEYMCGDADRRVLQSCTTTYQLSHRARVLGCLGAFQDAWTDPERHPSAENSPGSFSLHRLRALDAAARASSLTLKGTADSFLS